MLTHLPRFPQFHEFHGPLIGFAVALGLALASRFLRSGLLGAAAGGAGVLAGWYVMTGRLSVTGPPGSLEVLAALAVTALLFGLLSAWRGPGLQASIGVLGAALAAGWLLSGAPTHQAALRANWPIGLGVVIALLLLARLLADRAVAPMRLALAGLTLAAALHVAGAPAAWVQLALVPGLAALAMFALPASPGAAAVAVGVDVAGLGCLATIALGRLPRLALAPVDAAALSPLLALLLLPRITGRLGAAGRAAPLAGCLLAGAIAVGCVWLVRLIVPR